MKDSSFCCICFSGDRKVFLIENKELDFFNMVAEPAKQMIQYLHKQSALKICYECRGRVLSSQKFIKTVNDSIQIVKNYWASTSSKAVLPVSFKRLSQSKIKMTQYLPQNEPERGKKNYTAEIYCSSESIKVEKTGSYIEATKRGSDLGEDVSNNMKLEVDMPYDESSSSSTDVGKQDAKKCVSDSDDNVSNVMKLEVDMLYDESSSSSTDVGKQDAEKGDSEVDENESNYITLEVDMAYDESSSSTTDVGGQDIESSTSTELKDVVDVRTRSKTTLDSLELAKNGNTTKVATTKPKGPLTKWMNIWVTDEQALSWYATEVDQQNSTEYTCVCDHCKKGFAWKADLEKHLFCFHFDKRKLVCNICRYRFTTFRAMHEHMKYHYILYKCKMCDYNTRDLSLIQTHTGPDHKTVGTESWQISTDISAVNLYWCERCRVYFVSEAQFLTHSQKYGCHKIYMKCDFCSEVFLKFSSRKDHMQRFHNEEPPERNPREINGLTTSKRRENYQGGAVYCQLCGKFYQDVELYKKHVETNVKHMKTADRLFQKQPPERKSRGITKRTTSKRQENDQDGAIYCQLCCKFYQDVNLYKKHVETSVRHMKIADRIFHNKQSPERKPRGINKGTTSKRRENDQGGAFYCQLCDKFYEKKKFYKKHVETSVKHMKTTDRKQCPHCERSFPTKYSLIKHINVIHLNIRNFKCSECPKAYVARRKLELHFDRKHNKDFVPVKDKICDLCGAAFETNTQVKEHRRGHTGERPYKCKLCPSTFSYSGPYYTHNKLVHLKQKRNCDLKKTNKNKKN